MPSNEPSRTLDQSTNSSFPHGANTPKKDVDTEHIGGVSDKQRRIEDRQRWQRANSFNRSMNDVSFLNRSRTDFGSSDKKISRLHQSLRRNNRRVSQSLPSTPPSLKDRLWQKVRPKRRWEKYHDHGLSCHSQPRLLSSQDPQWRRHARESTQIDSSSEDASPLFYTPLESQGTKPLIMAGMLMATEELDRLSNGAREQERQDATV